MQVFSTSAEQQFNSRRHVEKILTRVAAGDVSVAYWEPGQTSPFHCHPAATEIYFCFAGGGVMRTPDGSVDVEPGMFTVHPPGELHEFANGSERTVLFRVRYGGDFSTRIISWKGNVEWKQTAEDVEYFRGVTATS